MWFWVVSCLILFALWSLRDGQREIQREIEQFHAHWRFHHPVPEDFEEQAFEREAMAEATRKQAQEDAEIKRRVWER